MKKSFAFRIIVITLVVINNLNVVAAGTTIREHDNALIPDHPHSFRYLKGTDKTIEKDEGEERAGPLNTLTRLKGLFRSDRNKMKDVKLNKRSASEALSKVKAILGQSKTPTKMTPTKIKNLETYARDNPDKWDAMTCYLEFVYGIIFVVFIGGGAIYGAWKYKS
ncbi:Secreted RxLR effector peptide protein [Phytophthora palmivora]|uniref:Secreted RxLR effector peptide protein n=1 Tax=Phytophthora palmivora TaxID=4796 RepID=A0A2P4Y7X6_9STRA|nr:Secreted RxLR effector peptide protein [Phytophthora palmivora]